MTGSNRRPPACKAGALPAELILQGLNYDKLRITVLSLLHNELWKPGNVLLLQGETPNYHRRWRA